MPSQSFLVTKIYSCLDSGTVPDSLVPAQFHLNQAYSLLFPGNVLYLVRQQATNAVHEAIHPPLGGLADEHMEAVPATLVEFAGAAGTVPVFTLPPHPLNCDQY